MKVTLNNKKTVVVAPAITKELETVTIARIVDLPIEKKVRVFIKELGRPLNLTALSGDNYGDWTDSDVESEVKAELAKLD